jgi:hypothetical protein
MLSGRRSTYARCRRFGSADGAVPAPHRRGVLDGASRTVVGTSVIRQIPVHIDRRDRRPAASQLIARST